MSFINLKKSFFVKNKLRINDKVFYKNSDESTWVFDNVLDSKNIIDVIDEDLLTLNDFNDVENRSNTLREVKRFFNFIRKKESFVPPLKLSDIFIKEGDNNAKKQTNNSEIKSFRFKNKFGINRHTFKFLAEDNFNYKKNVIKNNLYKNYNLYGKDLHKNLEFGFCNYNTLNFFSFSKDIRHGNLISYANPFDNSTLKNLYDLKSNNFTISCKVIFRSIENLSIPNCLIHIPGLINVYFINTKNNKIRIAATSKENTYKNILEISDEINSILKSNINETGIDEEKVIIQDSDSASIEMSSWYNFTVKSNSETGVTFYIDNEAVLTSENFRIENISATNDSYIMLGNTINYNHEEEKNVLLKRYFDLLFYNDNVDLNFSSLKNKDIYIPYNYSNFYNPDSFNQNINYNEDILESFHGELSDIRIYNRTLRNEEIELITKSYVTNLSSEIKSGLIFYVPVLYVPIEVSGKQIILANGKSEYLKYHGYYNHAFANTCGGLELNIGNYLIDFVLGSKPNVVVNIFDKNNFFKNIENVSSHCNTSDFEKIRTGNTLSEIYFDNIVIKSDYSRSDETNLIYNNLFILPNDNGIPEIDFDIISEFINRTNRNVDINFFRSINQHNQYYFNITCENVIDKNNFISDNINYKRFNTLFPGTQRLNSISIRKGEENKNYTNIRFPIFDISNILFHDESIDNYDSYIDEINSGGKLNLLYSKVNTQYRFTESNPSLRNIFSDKISLIDGDFYDNVLYKVTPLPYADFNKNQDNLFINIFDISTQMYNKKLKKTKFSFIDDNFISGKITLKDNGYYNLYRSDCNTKVADWNYVGHIFYGDGIICINNPCLYYFGKTDYVSEFESEGYINIKEINIPADAGVHNQSQNATYDNTLRVNEAAFNSEESFVYITDINLHDENFNIVAKAKLANPVPKKDTDKLIFKLKMDF